MNYPEHARTGTNAVGGSRQTVPSLRRDRGRPAPPTELVIVDLITQHNEQPHEELAGDGDFGFGTPAAMHEREVGALEIGIHARGMRGGLAKGEAEQRAALLGDVAEVMFIGGGFERRGEADVADHVLAVVKAGHGPQDDDGGQRRQGPDPGGGDEAGASGGGRAGGGGGGAVGRVWGGGAAGAR